VAVDAERAHAWPADRTSKFGRTFYPHKYRQFTHGYYSVNGRHLYVNRGLSYGQRVLSWCRPEITLFKLERRRRDRIYWAGRCRRRGAFSSRVNEGEEVAVGDRGGAKM